jgi:hypothetical protein
VTALQSDHAGIRREAGRTGTLRNHDGVYCQSERWPGKPVMDIQMVMKNLTDAKELIQSVMEKLKTA